MGLFSSFFSSSEAAIQENFIKVDMHSHLIPGIDDGVDSVEEALSVIDELKKQGYTKAITTPHIMGDFFKNTPEIIEEGLATVQKALRDRGDTFQLEAAAEYYLDEWFIDGLKKDERKLTFGDNLILVETSYMNKPANLFEVIFEMQSRGYKPVLAHPERYLYMYDEYEGYKEIYDRGVLFQLNINSLSGYYSKGAKAIAEKLIADDMVDFLGTDCHGMKHVNPMLKSFATKAFGKINSQRILNNQLL